jgi:Universal stress protein family
MFKKILVVINTTTDAKGVLTVALAYAKSCQSLLKVVDLSSVSRHSLKPPTKSLRSLSSTFRLKGITAEVIRPPLCSGKAICELAEQWEADLIVIDTEQPLLDDAPCAVLKVHYDDETATTSVQMMLKEKRFACDQQVRQRLEALYSR